MAENILGILLVTSTSRGRNVFRYPPDPTSPHARLSQPIYPSSTFTAKDFAVHRPLSRRLMLHNSVQEGKSDASIKSGKRSRWTGGADGSSEGASSRRPSAKGGLAAPVRSEEYVEESSADGSDSSETSEDSEYDRLWTKRQSDGRKANDGDSKAGTVKGNENGSIDSTRRGSLAPNGDPPVNSRTGASPTKDPDRFIESQYNSALNYSLDFLSDMLSPPRSACNRKFEICVDDLVFIGHPVCIGADGRWAYPEDDAEEHHERGRKGRPGPSHLRTVLEQREGSSPETNHYAKSDTDRKEDDGPPILNLFHLVLILDKPDPQPGVQFADGVAPATIFDEVYREIAFKWTAAAFALQVRENFIARQTWEIAKIRDKSVNEGIPLIECMRICYEKSALDRALNRLFLAIHELQRKPANPLYSFLPTTVTVTLSDLPISMVLSPRSPDTDEAWALWGELGDLSDSEDSASEDDPNERLMIAAGSNAPTLRVEPWQSLLLLDERAGQNAGEISDSLVGLAIVGTSLGSRDPVWPMPPMPRRGSGGTAEEDEGVLIKALIEACDVSKPLMDIAHILRYDLDGIVIPLARELVQNKKAILIDIINTRLRTIVMPTTIVEHAASLEDYTALFSTAFPEISPLPAFLAHISSSPIPFRDLLPEDQFNDLDSRKLYMSALLWLLRHDLLVQVHTRYRIVARPEVKEKAWLRLWHRRRERWLRLDSRRASSQRQESVESPLSGSLDPTTPRALSSTISSFEGSVPAPKVDQSYMDYDPDLELDSDVGEGEADHGAMHFTVEDAQPLPGDVPKFEGSFIFRPARAHKDEARWLKIIRETVNDIEASKFDLCVQYFDGLATFEEISYRTGLPRKELALVIGLFPNDIVTFLHP